MFLISRWSRRLLKAKLSRLNVLEGELGGLDHVGIREGNTYPQETAHWAALLKQQNLIGRLSVIDNNAQSITTKGHTKGCVRSKNLQFCSSMGQKLGVRLERDVESQRIEELQENGLLQGER